MVIPPIYGDQGAGLLRLYQHYLALSENEGYPERTVSTGNIMTKHCVYGYPFLYANPSVTKWDPDPAGKKSPSQNVMPPSYKLVYNPI